MHSNQHSNQHNFQLFEGMEWGDLRKLVHPKLHVDEFKSKMGDDTDVIVLSFKVKEKQPAEDLSAFIERGYGWVLDADNSAGDFEDGEYLVFVELDRDPHAAQRIFKLLTDMMNLTGQKIEDWHLQYAKDHKEFPLSEEDIRRVVPMTAQIYQSKYGTEEEVEAGIAAMQEAARVPVKKKAAKNEWTESLRVAAGLK